MLLFFLLLRNIGVEQDVRWHSQSLDNCGQNLVGRIYKSVFDVLIVPKPYASLISKLLLCQMILVSGRLDAFPMYWSLESRTFFLAFLGIFHHLGYILSCVAMISKPLIKRIYMYLSSVYCQLPLGRH